MRKKTSIGLALAGFLLLALGGCVNPALSEVDRRITYGVRIYPKPEHGYLKLSDSQVSAGAYVTIYANPEPGYILKEIIVQMESQNANPSTVNTPGPKYATPINSHTAITAVFSVKDPNKYSISVDPSINNGLIFPEWLSEESGKSIRINVMPEPGYDLVAGSLKVKGGVVPISANMPYTFTLPAEDVLIEGQFERLEPDDLKARAWKYLSAGQYDTAAALYESAYQQNKSDPELIFYSTLGLLGDILIDPDVRVLLGSGSLYFATVPGTLDDWVCDELYWTGIDADRWYTKYAATEYTPKSATLPRFYTRFSGFIKPFGDSPISQQPGPGHLNPAENTMPTREKFSNLLFWALISSYRNGFNPFLERVNRYMFGEKFEAALARAEKLPSDARVLLNPRLKGRFDLEDFYGSDDTYVGKAEMEYIFGNLLAVKGAFEYLSVYDWTIDLRNWLMDYVNWNDGLEEILNQMFALQKTNDTHKNLWKNFSTVTKMLPLKNNFLQVRDTQAMGRAVAAIRIALQKTNFALDYWYGAGGNTTLFTGTAKNSRLWLRQAWAQAKTAMDTGGVFYFPKRLPESEPGSYWPDGSQDNYNGDAVSVQYGNTVYGVKLSTFFTPGVFTLSKLFTTELGGRSPSLFKLEWYEDENDNFSAVFTGDYNYSLITEQIAGQGAEQNVAGTNFSAPYGIYSFEVNTKNLKTIFPKGFGDIGDANGGRALFCKVFPAIPLWPWAATYFTGIYEPAGKVYEFYHKTTVD